MGLRCFLGAHIPVDQGFVAFFVHIACFPAHGVEGHGAGDANALDLSVALVGRTDGDVFAGKNDHIAKERFDLGIQHIGKRLRQDHVGGNHIRKGGQTSQQATASTGHAVDDRIHHRLVADIDGQRPSRQVHISQSGCGAAADHVAGHDAVDRQTANGRQSRQHVHHAAHQGGNTLLGLELLDGAVAAVTVERDFPIRLSIDVGGQSQDSDRQTLTAQRLAIAVLGVQQSVSNLVGGCHSHHTL